MKRVSVRGIVFDGDYLLLIYRIRPEREYYVFPGGGVEDGESLIEALDREMEEELGVKVNFIKELYIIENEDSKQHFMLCEYKSGDFGLGSGPEYNSLEYKDSGQYIPVKLNIDNLSKYNIVPPKIKEQLLKDLKLDKSLLSIKLTSIIE